MLAGAEVGPPCALRTARGPLGGCVAVHTRVPGSPPHVNLAGVDAPGGPIGLDGRAPLAPGPSVGCRIAARAAAAGGTATLPLLAIPGIAPAEARPAPAASLCGLLAPALDAQVSCLPRRVATPAPGAGGAAAAFCVRAVDVSLGHRPCVAGAVGDAFLLQAGLTPGAARRGRSGAALGTHPGGDSFFHAALLSAPLPCAVLTAVSTASIPDWHDDLHGVAGTAKGGKGRRERSMEAPPPASALSASGRAG